MRICIFGGGAIIAGHLAGSQVSLSASSRPISPAIRNRSAGGSCHWSGIALDPGRRQWQILAPERAVGPSQASSTRTARARRSPSASQTARARTVWWRRCRP